MLDLGNSLPALICVFSEMGNGGLLRLRVSYVTESIARAENSVWFLKEAEEEWPPKKKKG